MWTSWGRGHYSANHKEGDRERTSGFSEGAGPFAQASVSGVGTLSGSSTVCGYCHHGRAACASVVSLKLYSEDF